MAGYRYFFVDAHLPGAGPFLDYEGASARGVTREAWSRQSREGKDGPRSPYHAYRLGGARSRPPIAALVRDPDSTLRVWSRGLGYPGEGAYLEFHKIRWPEGLKLWRVTGGNVDLGGKQPYDPAVANERARGHGQHFAGLLAETAAREPDGDLIVAPFDTELFGHWWFEGVDFLGELFRSLQTGSVAPTTAREHLAARPATQTAALSEGSWGAHGDFSMWMNPGTAWTWHRLWPLEDAYWGVARAALAAGPKQRAVLEQATRSLLLAQASDWQFIISTGAATDYAEQRFRLHCEDAEALVAALDPSADAGALDAAVQRAAALRDRDDVFPGVLQSVAEVVG